MLISKSGLNRVAISLTRSSKAAPQWAFTDTWTENVFEGSVFEGDAPENNDTIWQDIGRQAAEYLASREGRYAVCVPLTIVGELPVNGFDPSSLEKLQPGEAKNVLYFVVGDEDPYEKRAAGWFTDDVKQPTGLNSWVGATQSESGYRLDLWFETKKKPSK